MSEVRICIPGDDAHGVIALGGIDLAPNVWSGIGTWLQFSNVHQRDGRNTVRMDNSSLLLSAASLAALDYDDKSFRIRFWWKSVSIPSFSALISGYTGYSSGNKGFALFENHSSAPGKLTLAYNGGTPWGYPAMTSTTSMVAGTQYHIQFSVQRNSSSSFTYRIFVNGVLEETKTTTTGILRSGRFAIGSTESLSYSNGYLSDFEMVIGDHGESATFTPPVRIAARLGGTIVDDTNAPAVRKVRILRRSDLSNDVQAMLNSAVDGTWSKRVPQGVYNVTIEDDAAGTVLKDVHFGGVTAVPE